MTDLKVVELHDGRRLLSDVSGRLRLLADQIDSGAMGDVVMLAANLRGAMSDVDFALVVLDSEENLLGDRYVLGLFDVAREIHLRRIFDAADGKI